MSDLDWRLLGYCPRCGKHSFYVHNYWDDGCSVPAEYARCRNCEAAFHIREVEPDQDYYGKLMAETEESNE